MSHFPEQKLVFFVDLLATVSLMQALQNLQSACEITQPEQSSLGGEWCTDHASENHIEHKKDHLV